MDRRSTTTERVHDDISFIRTHRDYPFKQGQRLLCWVPKPLLRLGIERRYVRNYILDDYSLAQVTFESWKTFPMPVPRLWPMDIPVLI